MALIEKGWSALLVSLGESAPFVVLGLLLAGLIREFVPAGTLKKRMGGTGTAPVLQAVGLGAVLPICSCSTIPLGLGMTRSGTGTGTALAFMTSAPALSPVTVVLGLSLLGPLLLGSYAVAVLCGSCLIGLVGNTVLRARGDQLATAEVANPCGCGCKHEAPSAGKRLTNAIHWALFDLGREVSLSLLAGLAVATILLVFTPDAWILELVGYPGPLAILAVILLALPAYTCSVPALLIAASLIAKGADPGVAVAFLIAGPATNLGELNAIRVGMGLRAVAYYFVAVILLAVASAWAIGALPLSTMQLGTLDENSHRQHSHLHFGDALADSQADSGAAAIPTWRWPFVSCIVALACLAIARNARTRRSKAEQSPPIQTITTRAGLAPADGHGAKIWN